MRLVDTYLGRTGDVPVVFLKIGFIHYITMIFIIMLDKPLLSMRSSYYTAIMVLSLTSLMAQSEIHIMIVTGGHSFERESFFGMFEQFEGVTYQELVQPKANQQIENGLVDDFDLLLFYDMYDSITSRQKDAYLRLVRQKKPMLFLHHSLVSYQDWPEFTQIIGGKYHTKDSSQLSYYQHDDTIQVKVSPVSHPVIEGLHDFTIIDETYGNCEILPSVVPLLETDHPRSLPVIGWVNSYLGHKMVYLQGGHGPSAFKDPNFLKVLDQAIRWSVNHR